MNRLEQLEEIKRVLIERLAAVEREIAAEPGWRADGESSASFGAPATATFRYDAGPGYDDGAIR